jgi:hypothetical protein
VGFNRARKRFPALKSMERLVGTVFKRSGTVLMLLAPKYSVVVIEFPPKSFHCPYVEAIPEMQRKPIWFLRSSWFLVFCLCCRVDLLLMNELQHASTLFL